MDIKLYGLTDINNPKLQKALVQVHKEFPARHYNHMQVWDKFWDLIKAIEF